MTRTFTIVDHSAARYFTRPPFELVAPGCNIAYYSTREAADAVGQRWVAEGTTPSQQGDEANRAEMAKRYGVVA